MLNFDKMSKKLEEKLNYSKIEVVNSYSGWSLYIDGNRVSGPKPIHGEIHHTFKAKKKDVCKAMGAICR